jgi:hypothetical protein
MKSIYRMRAVPINPAPGDEYIAITIELPASTRALAVARARRLFPLLYISRLERIAILAIPPARKAKQ